VLSNFTDNQTDATTAEQAGQDPALRLARTIHGTGLSSVARIGLEALKPLHWIAGQFAWALEPFLGALTPLSRKSATSTGNIARMLEQEDGITRIVAHLDILVTEDDRTTGKETAHDA
jgi:hypothetical protein